MIWLDLARLFLGTALLAFASYTDWMWRRAPNVLWIVLAAAGVALLVVEAFLDWGAFWEKRWYLAFIPVFWVFIVGFYYFGLIAGGADAKALLALALLVPFPILFSAALPLVESPLPGVFAVLENSLIAFLLIPLTMGLVNALRGDFHLPAMFLGIRRPLEGIEDRHEWPMERVVEGNVRMKYFASRTAGPIQEEAAALREKGVTHVWVTPKVPYMIPLLVGFVLAFTVGDLLFGLLRVVLPQG